VTAKGVSLNQTSLFVSARFSRCPLPGVYCFVSTPWATLNESVSHLVSGAIAEIDYVCSNLANVINIIPPYLYITFRRGKEVHLQKMNSLFKTIPYKDAGKFRWKYKEDPDICFSLQGSLIS